MRNWRFRCDSTVPEAAEDASDVGLAFVSTNPARERHIYCVGAAAIAGALPKTRVVFLNLSANKIRNLGAQKLSEMLAQHPLQTLDLSYNEISDEGAVRLSEGVENNPSLTSLDLRGQPPTTQSNMT